MDALNALIDVLQTLSWSAITLFLGFAVGFSLGVLRQGWRQRQGCMFFVTEFYGAVVAAALVAIIGTPIVTIVHYIAPPILALFKQKPY